MIGIYEENNIYNEDCLAAMRKMPPESVNLILTDPPYLTRYKTNRRTDKRHEFCGGIINDANPEFIRDYFVECYKISKTNSAIYSFCDIDRIELFKEFICNAGYSIKNVIIWVKDNWTAGDLKAQFGQQYECIVYANKGRAEIKGKRYSDIWNFARVSPEEQIHQNQKPIPLLSRAIMVHSSEGEIVFDGCIGSGSTCIAARKLRRKYLGFEIDTQKFISAQRRIETAFRQFNLLYD